MRFQPQKMLLICILLFLQCSHNSTMFVGWLPYIILKKIQPQNLLLIYSFWNYYSFFNLASLTPPWPSPTIRVCTVYNKSYQRLIWEMNKIHLSPFLGDPLASLKNEKMKKKLFDKKIYFFLRLYPKDRLKSWNAKVNNNSTNFRRKSLLLHLLAQGMKEWLLAKYIFVKNIFFWIFLIRKKTKKNLNLTKKLIIFPPKKYLFFKTIVSLLK